MNLLVHLSPEDTQGHAESGKEEIRKNGGENRLKIRVITTSKPK
jgi:hypothetical protein